MPGFEGIYNQMNTRFKYSVVTLSTVLVGLLLIGALLGQSTDAGATDPYRHLNVFTEVFAKIKSDYVEEPDMANVTLGAINGLLVSMDPFSSYLNADQYKAWLKSKETAKGGVGLVLSRKYGYEIGVVDAIEGSPADKAGLSTGDILEAINGISTRDMPLAYADVLLHGDPGTTLELTVLRMRRPEATPMKLTRAIVLPPALESRMVDTTTGLVAVRDLTTGKTAGVASAIRNLQRQGAKKLVLDIRHCAVSDPAEGVALANLFMDEGAIGSLEGQRVPKQSFTADPASTVWKGPLVVLTNRGSAGAAEIAATALLDSKRAEVVGERTYGDAALRRPVMTEDGGAVLLAVAKYYGPSGKAIQDTSVTPGHVVTETEPDTPDTELEAGAPDMPNAPKPPQAAPKPSEDVILKKALEVLNGKAEKQVADAGTGAVLLPGEHGRSAIAPPVKR